MSAANLSVFVRAVEPGKVKTRLVPALGEAGAARLYAAFVEDTLSHVQGFAGPVVVWCAGAADHPSLAALGVPERRAQPALDLGGRLRSALGEGLEAAPVALAIGSDSPTLPAHYLDLAVRALGMADMVLGPAIDGGYYLIGLGRQAQGALAQLFDGVRWSSASTLRDTETAAQRLGLRVAHLPPWYDVDCPGDLPLLRLHLAIDGQAAPATARALLGF